MRKTIFALTALLALALSTAAFATAPFATAFAEDWEASVEDDPIALSTQWTGDNTSMKVVAGQWGALYGNGLNTYAWTAANFGASMNGVGLQLFHLDMSSNGGPGTGNRTYVYVLDKNGAVWLRWYGDSVRVMPRYGNNVGPAQYLTPGVWKDLDIVYNSVTGVVKWFNNSSEVYTWTVAAGNYMTRVEIQSNNGIATDAILVDNIKVGAIPEPSSLLALSGFGLGMLGYIRRRRA